LDEHAFLAIDSMIDTALKDAAAVTMSAYIQTIASDFVEDEVGIFRLEVIKALLDDVITVQILDETDDVGGQRMLDGLDLIAINRGTVVRRSCSTNLLASGNELDHLLEGTGTMLVQRDFDHVWSSVVDESGALIIVAVFEQLLAEVVPERI
jgi:hypothetical protein